MLRRIIPTAKRTVTRGSNKKTIDKGDAIRERPLLSGIEVPSLNVAFFMTTTHG